MSRIDNLVDRIYDEFRHDYYPGEAVTVEISTGERLQGTVRDKTRFGSKVQPDGSVGQPFSRYFVSLHDRPEEEAVVDDHHISRDRKVFTKSVLRSFIKKTVTREAWNGAPWLVKHEYAFMYHIDTRIPIHLRHDTKLQERKQLAAQKKALHPGDANGSMNSHEPARLPELKPAKSHKSKAQQAQALDGRANGIKKEPKFIHVSPGDAYEFASPVGNSAPPPSRPTTPPPPPPKYPIEDLQVGPRAGIVRPKLRFLCADPPSSVTADGPHAEKIKMESVGPLLETWDTLNVYCEVFVLDSFTFDDYVEALCVSSEEAVVPLIEEIHCSILKVLVNSEQDDGKVQIELPEIEDEDEESEDEEAESAEATPTPEPEPKNKRATRGSLAKLEAERIAAEAAEEERQKEAAAIPLHRAEELLEDYDWIEHLQKRDFKEGGWERIIVGLLHQLSKDERRTEACEQLLSQLVPGEIEHPTQQTVEEQYAKLDANTRVQILQVLCMLTTETKAIRGYMEDCSEQMTGLRKQKIEWQRQRKQA